MSIQVRDNVDDLQKLGRKLEVRTGIQEFEKRLGSIPGATFGDSKTCPLKHTFSENLYVREIFIPKGTLLVGKIHRHSHPNILMTGEVSVVTETGGTERLKAPMSMVSKPGTKRIVYAHEDTIWVTIHEVGKERDLEKIEDVVIAESYDELEYSEKQMLRSDEENIEKLSYVIRGAL